jgi:hypothetical protein
MLPCCAALLPDWKLSCKARGTAGKKIEIIQHMCCFHVALLCGAAAGLEALLQAHGTADSSRDVQAVLLLLNKRRLAASPATIHLVNTCASPASFPAMHTAEQNSGRQQRSSVSHVVLQQR